MMLAAIGRCLYYMAICWLVLFLQLAMNENGLADKFSN